MQLAGPPVRDAERLPLVAMPDKCRRLLVERFDIRESASDTRMLALEDMCSSLIADECEYDGL